VRTPQGIGIVGVEGKADEAFGEVVRDWLSAGVDTVGASHQIAGINSSPGKVARLKSLCRTLNIDVQDSLALRYQLLHRTVAIILEAKRFNCSQALLLVHHFSDVTNNLAGSFSDFVNFGVALGAPIPRVNSISQVVVLDGIQLRLAWVDDQCTPQHGVGVRGLILALGMAMRFEGVENELARYWQLRFDILTELFELPPEWAEDTTRTPMMISSLAQETCNDGFFEQFIEYSWLPCEKAIFERHELNVRIREETLRETLFEFAEDLLLKSWPKVRGKFWAESDLVSKGLPPCEPDRIDFI
jgi:hypothetical protein